MGDLTPIEPAWQLGMAGTNGSSPAFGSSSPSAGPAICDVRALARVIDAKDPTTRAHSARVTAIAGALAERLGWPAERVALLQEAALVHDVGKIGVPVDVLFAARALDGAEYELVKRHAALGAEICAGLLLPEQVEWIRQHHERPDGAGYPDGLRDSRISAGSAILAVADAFDVMTTERPYSAAKSAEEALRECALLVGRQFSAAPVAALLAVYGAVTVDRPGVRSV